MQAVLSDFSVTIVTSTTGRINDGDIHPSLPSHQSGSLNASGIETRFIGSESAFLWWCGLRLTHCRTPAGTWSRKRLTDGRTPHGISERSVSTTITSPEEQFVFRFGANATMEIVSFRIEPSG